MLIKFSDSVHLVKRFQIFLEIDQPECLWRPCLLTDRDEISNLYRVPSIDASCEVLFHLPKQTTDAK